MSFNRDTPADDSATERKQKYTGAWEGNEQYASSKAGLGRAAKFDGNSRIVVNALKGFAWGNRFSVSCFFKRTDASGYQGIINNGYYKFGSFEIRMGPENGGQMIGGGVTTKKHAETWDHVGLKATLNQWHHVAMVYDDEQLDFWIDGVPAETASKDSGSLIIHDSPVVIGQ